MSKIEEINQNLTNFKIFFTSIKILPKSGPKPKPKYRKKKF